MSNNKTSATAFTINIIALAHGLFACICSMLILVIIVYHLCKNRVKRENKIVFILSANIYFLLFIYTATLISLNIDTLLGDLYDRTSDSPWCTFRGYFISVMLGALYYGFVIQALFRLCRIVYSPYRRLQWYWLYIILMILLLIVSSVMLCPLLVWHDIIYLPNEYYCFNSFRNVRAMVLTAFSNYGIPLFSLSFIYFRIMRFICRQPDNQAVTIKRRQQRDLLVIKRIVIIVNILLILGIPSIVLIAMLYATGVENPLDYRITWLSVEVSVAIISVILMLMTPQLKTVVMKRSLRNRVTPLSLNIDRSMEVRTNRTNEEIRHGNQRRNLYQ